MTSDSSAPVGVSEWASGCRTRTGYALAETGHAADLMRTDPGAAARTVDGLLARQIPALLDRDEWIRLHSLVTAFLGEFLISVHGARWAWLDDSASPVGGRWVVTGFRHPPGRRTAPVDVGTLVSDALAAAADVAAAVGFVALVDRAERAAGLRAGGGPVRGTGSPATTSGR